MYPSVQSRPDFIVSSSTGEKQLLIEIKRWLPSAIEDAPATWVKQTRERWQLPTGYVLLVTPERMVLWPPQSSVAPSVSPSVSPSGAPSVRPSGSAYQGAPVTKAPAEVFEVLRRKRQNRTEYQEYMLKEIEQSRREATSDPAKTILVTK